MPKDFRMQRISDLIRTSLSEILLRETEDKRFHSVTITKVVVSRDLSHARIYISVMPDQSPEEVTQMLNHAAKQLRYHLAQEIEMRVTPELRFFFDDSAIKGQRISELLNKALKDKD